MLLLQFGQGKAGPLDLGTEISLDLLLQDLQFAFEGGEPAAGFTITVLDLLHLIHQTDCFGHQLRFAFAEGIDVVLHLVLDAIEAVLRGLVFGGELITLGAELLLLALEIGQLPVVTGKSFDGFGGRPREFAQQILGFRQLLGFPGHRIPPGTLPPETKLPGEPSEKETNGIHADGGRQKLSELPPARFRTAGGEN